MDNVDFSGNGDDNVTIYEKKSRGLNAFVQKIGLVKSERGTNIALIIAAIIFFLAAIAIYIDFFVPVSIFGNSQKEAPPTKHHAAQQTTS